MKVKVKKTIVFSRHELRLILGALDEGDGSPYPQAQFVDMTEEQRRDGYKNLAANIRKEITTNGGKS